MSKHVQKYPRHRVPALPFPAALLLIATPACVPGAEHEPGLDIDPSWTSGLDDVDLSPIAPTGDQWNSCPTWDCNKNHPMLTGFPVPEINENGVPDDRGLSLQSFWHSTEFLRLDVERGEIKGYDLNTGVLDVSGPLAVGTILTMANAKDMWRIRIDGYARIPYWDGTGTVPAYRLLYQRAGDSPTLWTNVCKEPAEPAADPEWPGAFETYALLISDERYDRDAKKVRDDGSAEGWFTIACAGTSLAKMILMHYDPHLPSTDWYYTSPDRRTTTLKMLTADYLGIGEAFTESAKELQWADSLGWNTEPFPNVSEAVWDENGAVCLDTPRLASAIPDILLQIENVCTNTPGCTMPPACSDLGISDVNWPLYGQWRTWNP